MRISVILGRLKIEDIPFLKPLQISPHQKSLFHTVQYFLQAADEIPFCKDGRIYPNLCKNSPLWKCLNTHNKSPVPAQWFVLGISFLEIFYTVGILSKNFYNAGRWKFLIAIDWVLYLNLELAFFEVFLIDWTFILHTHYLKKKIKQQNYYNFSFSLFCCQFTYLLLCLCISVSLLRWHTDICTCMLIYIMLSHTHFFECSLYLDIRGPKVYRICAECVTVLLTHGPAPTWEPSKILLQNGHDFYSCFLIGSSLI